MRLALVADDGQILDSTGTFTREEWDRARIAPLGAISLLQDLNADAT